MKPLSLSSTVPLSQRVLASAPKNRRGHSPRGSVSRPCACPGPLPLRGVPPPEASNLVVREQLDVLLRHDPLDEIAGHALAHVLAPHEQVKPSSCARPGTVPPDRPSCRRRRPRLPRPRTAAPRLAWRRSGRTRPRNGRGGAPPGCGIGPSSRLPRFGPRYRHPPRDLCGSGRPPFPGRPPRGGQRWGAELVGLHQGAAGELEAGEPRWEAQVILYSRRGARPAPPRATDSRASVERPSEAP
jgi:hypothetical protein